MFGLESFLSKEEKRATKYLTLYGPNVFDPGFPVLLKWAMKH